ncbi:MAG: hypothetical protein ACREXY_09445, partial [Gammaproteobacteria bacterium]
MILKECRKELWPFVFAESVLELAAHMEGDAIVIDGRWPGTPPVSRRLFKQLLFSRRITSVIYFLDGGVSST